jgi:hypothetical protein
MNGGKDEHTNCGKPNKRKKTLKKMQRTNREGENACHRSNQ